MCKRLKSPRLQNSRCSTWLSFELWLEKYKWEPSHLTASQFLNKRMNLCLQYPLNCHVRAQTKHLNLLMGYWEAPQGFLLLKQKIPS